MAIFRRFKFLIIILIIVIGLLVMWLVMPQILQRAAKEKAAPKELLEKEIAEEATSVRAYKVARSDFTDILPVMGTVKGYMQVELKFEVNGVVDSFKFREGDLVRKADIIATIDPKDALLKLDYSQSKAKAAEAQTASNKKKLEIYQRLYDIGAIIKAKLEEVQLEYEAAKAQAESAQKEVEFSKLELDKTYLYSPMSGFLGTRNVEVGEFVTPNAKVATLIRIDNVFVEVGIIEKDIDKLSLGQKAKVNVDTYPGVDFWGEVDNIAPMIEGKSRTLTAKIKVPNPKSQLLPGMFARTDIMVFEKKNTIIIPAVGLQDLNGDGVFESVYVVREGDIAGVQNIIVGYTTTDYAQIEDGLNEGDIVVTESLGELKDGAKVKLLEVQEAAMKGPKPAEGVRYEEPKVPGVNGD